MKIAPIDIAHKTFSRKVMGLDPDEVADFMRDIAEQMEELIRERNSLKENARQKDLQLMEFKERDEALKSTIHTAAKMSDGIRADAEREGKLIINDAQQKAEMVLKDSRDQLRRVYQEIADLKRMRMQFEINVRSICQAHVALIEQSHMVHPDPQVGFANSNSTNATNATGAAHASNANAPSQNNSQGHSPAAANSQAMGAQFSTQAQFAAQQLQHQQQYAAAQHAANQQHAAAQAQSAAVAAPRMAGPTVRN